MQAPAGVQLKLRARVVSLKAASGLAFLTSEMWHGDKCIASARVTKSFWEPNQMLRRVQVPTTPTDANAPPTPTATAGAAPTTPTTPTASSSSSSSSHLAGTPLGLPQTPSTTSTS